MKASSAVPRFSSVSKPLRWVAPPWARFWLQSSMAARAGGSAAFRQTASAVTLPPFSQKRLSMQRTRLFLPLPVISIRAVCCESTGSSSSVSRANKPRKPSILISGRSAAVL